MDNLYSEKIIWENIKVGKNKKFKFFKIVLFWGEKVGQVGQPYFLTSYWFYDMIRRCHFLAKRLISLNKKQAEQTIINAIDDSAPLEMKKRDLAYIGDCVVKSFDQLGGVDWLTRFAKDEPKKYIDLLGKLLPAYHKVNAEVDGRVDIKIVSYSDSEDVWAAFTYLTNGTLGLIN